MPRTVIFSLFPANVVLTPVSRCEGGRGWLGSSRRQVGRTGHEGKAMPEAVLTEVSDCVAVITINRPEARNAVNGDVARGIATGVDEFDASKDVQVLILTGAGGTFSAGMDLKGF